MKIINFLFKRKEKNYDTLLRITRKMFRENNFDCDYFVYSKWREEKISPGSNLSFILGFMENEIMKKTETNK